MSIAIGASRDTFRVRANVLDPPRPRPLSDHPRLLASDLDGTLIPPVGTPGDGGVEALSRELRQSKGLLLAYVTGRHRSLALEGIRRHALPRPDILVCDVGTSVYLAREGEFEIDRTYRARMVSALSGTDTAELRRLLGSVPRIRPQEPEKQAEFKLSYYTPPGREGEEVVAQARELLREFRGDVSLVYSVDEVASLGLLDVLPARVAKDSALRYLHERTGVDDRDLVYAGDSGNDRAAMLTGFNVVVVGNAAASLKDSIRSAAEDLHLTPRIYFADGSYALGVLEGCRHFGLM